LLIQSGSQQELIGESRISSARRNHVCQELLSWTRHTLADRFQSEDKKEVEAYCQQHEITCEWKGKDSLRTQQVCHALAIHPRTGQEIWFNQAHMFHVSGLDEKTRQILLHLCAEEDFRGMHTTEMENQSRKKHWRIFVKHSKLKAFFSNGNPKICCCWTTC
jgi:hypothetical protein